MYVIYQYSATSISLGGALCPAPACVRRAVGWSRSIAGECRGRGLTDDVQPRSASAHAMQVERTRRLSLFVRCLPACQWQNCHASCTGTATAGRPAGSFSRLVRWSRPRCLPGRASREGSLSASARRGVCGVRQQCRSICTVRARRLALAIHRPNTFFFLSNVHEHGSH
jgi:hypothetical protein